MTFENSSKVTITRFDISVTVSEADIVMVINEIIAL